jgi:hypothetical protein
MVEVEPAFLASGTWQGLSEGAKAAMLGMLQFAMLRHVQWTVEGSPAQVAAWIGDESGLGRKIIQDGLAELEAAGMLKRGRVGAATSGFIITAPLVGH